MTDLHKFLRSLSLLLPVLLCLALFSPVQATSTWNKIYGNKSGTAYSVIETPDAGYAIAGSSTSDKTLVVKTDSLGNMLWSKTYQDGEIRSIVAASDGGYALAGTTELGEQYSEFWLVKTDVNGTVEWEKTYARASSNQVNMAIVTSDGGYVLLGDSWSSESPLFTWLVKTDAEGKMQWNKTYQEGSAVSIVQASDGGYVMAGTAGGDFWWAKTDEYGNLQWNHTYGGTEIDEAYSLVQTPDGGYALVGEKNRIPQDLYFAHGDIWLGKMDSEGIMQWNKTYGEGIVVSLVLTSEGGYAITGRTVLDTPPAVWLLKTGALGNSEWMQYYVSDDAHKIFPYCLITTSDGGYALAGYNIDLGTYFWLMKTDEFGIVAAVNPTQQPTSTPTSTAPSPSPPIPELSLLVIMPLMLSVLSLALILRYRKQFKKP